MSPGVILAAVLAAAPAPSGTAPVRVCLSLADSSFTSYHPIDDHTVIIESGSRWYELTTTPSAFMLQPESYFVNEIRGTSTLCSPLDFQLSVVEQPAGFREGIIVQSFREITPAEGKVLRRGFVR